MAEKNISAKRVKRIWSGMKQRCNNPNAHSYNHYGGRGIKVCEEWQNSFIAFYKWAIENGYSDNLTIDRLNVNGNYEPSNCRWTTTNVQGNNRRRYWLPKNQEYKPYIKALDSKETIKQRDIIRLKLYENDLTQTWLLNRLEERGLITDKTELSSALSGTRVGAKIETLYKLSIDILNDYETGFKK